MQCFHVRSKLSTQSNCLTEICVNKFLKQVFRGILFQGNEDFPGERGEFFLVMLPIKSFQIKVSRAGGRVGLAATGCILKWMGRWIDRYALFGIAVESVELHTIHHWSWCCSARNQIKLLWLIDVFQKLIQIRKIKVSEFENLKGPLLWLAQC